MSILITGGAGCAGGYPGAHLCGERPSGGKQLRHGQSDHRHQQYRAPQPCGRKTFQGEGRAQGDKELKHACSHSGGVFRQCAGKRR